MSFNPRCPAYGRIFENKPEVAEIAKQVWHDSIEHLREHDLLTKPRARIVDRYARAVAEYEELYPQIVESGPVKKGPNGGDVFDYTWSAIEKLQTRIARFEGALMIAPKASEGKLKAPSAPEKGDAASEFLGSAKGSDARLC